MFYWIYLSNIGGCEWDASFIVCINPCFTGLTSQTRYPHPLLTFPLTFQSLFYWIYLSNQDILWLPDKVAWVSILVLLDLPLKHLYDHIQYDKTTQFQSLFYWIYLSNSPVVYSCRECKQFQSLFYWIYLSNYFIC